MAPPRRLYGKQPPTSGSSADRMLGTGAKARKERTKKRSKLAKATQSGLVPRAQRPFAIYCKMTRQHVQEASQVWKRLSAKGRQPYIEASQRTFKDQQKKSKEVGLRYKSAMAVELDAKDQQPVVRPLLLDCFARRPSRIVHKLQRHGKHLEKKSAKSMSSRIRTHEKVLMSLQASLNQNL